MTGYLKGGMMYEGYEWNKIGRSVQAMKHFLLTSSRILAADFPENEEGVRNYEIQYQQKSVHGDSWFECTKEVYEYEFHQNGPEWARIIAIPLNE